MVCWHIILKRNTRGMISSTDTFYNACDQNCFENSSNDLEDEDISNLFYNLNISSFDYCILKNGWQVMCWVVIVMVKF